MPGNLSPRRRAVRIVCLLLATACGALLFVEMRRHGLPLLVANSSCLFRHAVGIPCPVCGFTRALLALALGDWREVLRLHPLVPLVALEWCAVWLAWAAYAAGWQPPLTRTARERFAEKVILANAALFVVVWGGRLYFHTLPL